MTILQFAEIVRKIAESKSRLVFHPLPVDDPKVRQPNIQKAQKLLDWTPQCSLEEGLTETLKWMKKKISQQI